MKKKLLFMAIIFTITAECLFQSILISHASSITVGDYAVMGSYLGESILWRCVDIDDHGPLMLSDKILCIKAFDAAGTNTTGSHGRGLYVEGVQGYNRQDDGSNYWGDSNIRDWLNSAESEGNVVWSCGNSPDESHVLYGTNAYNNEAGFLSNFTDEEKMAISTVTQKQLLDGYENSNGSSNVINSNYHIYESVIDDIVQNYDSAYSEYVTDKIFLLDVKQLYNVYKNLGNYYLTECTATAVSDSEYSAEEISTSSYGFYWLRSPYANEDSNSVRVVNPDGDVGARNAFSYRYGVRPAFYLNLQTAVFTSGSGTESNPYILSGSENGSEIKAENIYENNERDLNFDSSSFDLITDSNSAESLMINVVDGMSSAEIGSVKAKDQLAYLAEEAAARAATIETEDDIVINQENTEEALSAVSAVVDSAESVISSSNVSVKSVRSKVRYSTSKSSSVSISKENITADVDVVEAVTPFGSFEFEPASVSELTVDSEGANKISVGFNKTDSTSKVTVKFPNVTSDGYKAVVDEEGNVIGGKYNPITDELSAKIDESGVFTVITNEKDFSDIKSQPAEVQAAIKKLASKGIIKGTSETEFSPDSPITRAEIAALIVRILDVDDPNADGGFSDVTSENWYFGSAGSSKRENIIAGYEDNTFRGTVVIPKVQITSVTARVLTNRLGYYSASESVLNEFSDVDTIAQWARSDVALAAYANMVIRRTDGSFEPNMEMTRGDAAVILEKLFDKVW